MEAEITKGIPSRFICDWMYVYMWFIFVFAALYLALGIGGAVTIKANLATKALMVLPSLIGAAFLALTGMSFYVMCERGIKPQEESVLH